MIVDYNMCFYILQHDFEEVIVIFPVDYFYSYILFRAV